MGTRGADALEGGVEDLRLVEEEDVAGAEFVRQVTDSTVAQLSVFHHEEFCAVARRRRAERDAVFGEVEVEEVGFHGIAPCQVHGKPDEAPGRARGHGTYQVP